MRVAYVTEAPPDAPPTGGTLRRDGLVGGLRALGHDVTVVHLPHRDGPLALRHRRTPLGEHADVVHLEGLPLAPLARRAAGACTVVDLCDSWHLVRTGATGLPLRARLRRTGSRLSVAAVMRADVARADGVVYVGERDRDHDRRRFRSLPPSAVVANGVDEELWALGPAAAPRAVMLADWSYAPNLEGLGWYVDQVLPLLGEQAPELVLHGPQPPARALPPSVRWGGFAARRADAYRDAAVVLAPLLSGAGTKNKVLEGVAAGRPVVTTPEGAHGVPAHAGNPVVAATPQEFARAVVQVLRDRPDVSAARAALRDRSWQAAAAGLVALYEAVRRG